MNPARLLEHFDRIAEAPDAIPRLRRLILDLAVRGKLVEQDPNDEPASELLKRIQAEKARLIKAGKIKKLEVDPAGEDEAPFELPANWHWTRLGAIGDWGAGSTPSRGNPGLYGGGLTWLKSGELNDNLQLKGSEETITELAVQKGSFRLNRPGDVLIAMYGATIGKLAILAEEAVTNQAVCGCTPFSGVSNRYLYLFLLSQRAQFHAASEGGAQPNISKVKIVKAIFPLPPLAEQHRIVAKIDELMALCDRLEATQAKRESRRDRLASASLKRISQPEDVGNGEEFRENVRFHLGHLPRLTTRLEHIKELRQTILNLAVRGKLVPQDPNDEPAADLLKKIQAEKNKSIANGEHRKEKFIALNTVADIDFEPPRNWAWATLGQIALDFRYGTSAKCDYGTKGVPVLRIPNVENGKINISDLKFGALNDREISNLKLEEGDILIIRSNGSLSLVGRPALVESHASGFCYAGYLVRVRTASEFINPVYILNALNSTWVRDQIEIPIRTTVGLKNINTSELSGLRISVPPLAEQHRIVAKLSELMALCDQLEAQINTSQADRSRLLEATLREALGISNMPALRAGRTISSRATSAPRQAERPLQAAKPRLVEPAHTVPQRCIADQPKPASDSRPQSATEAILAQMKPGHDYSRAQLCDALGLSVYEWNMAIRALKDKGTVIQTGEKRGARYRLNMTEHALPGA